mgnify:CR=1 FL=1
MLGGPHSLPFALHPRHLKDRGMVGLELDLNHPVGGFPAVGTSSGTWKDQLLGAFTVGWLNA